MTKSAQFQTVDNFETIRVTGSDSEKFLQGQLTCDLADANGKGAVLGGYCNVQGRLHGTFYLLKVEDDYLMLAPTGVAEHLVTTLSKYAVFFDADLTIDTDLGLLAYEIESSHEDYEQWDEDDHCLSQFQLGKLTLAIIIKDQLKQFKSATLVDYQESEHDLLALQQIELGIPMIMAETIETLLPHHIGLAQVGGVNFEKGCYTGQEIVARMHYRGTLKTHAQKAIINSEDLIKAGTVIENSAGKKVGELVNSATNGQQQMALISLADKALDSTLIIERATVDLKAN